MSKYLLILVGVFLALGQSVDQTNAQVLMPAYVTGAGASQTSDGQLAIVGTFGQPMVGAVGNNSQMHRAGFWIRIASGLPSSVERLEGSELPRDYKLDGNYPNPFNPTTTIRFSIPEQAPVRLVVYDMLGKVVAVLADKEMAAGEYRVSWDARDGVGNSVSSGSYLYRLESTNYASVKVMTLLK
jgi:hypothetical protein